MELREVNYSRDVTAPAACGCEIPHPAEHLRMVTPREFKVWADGIAEKECMACRTESGFANTTWEEIANAKNIT